MRERGVQIESWGPFAQGKNDLFTNPTLAAIGAAHGKSIGQVVLRWLTQRQVVVIPSRASPHPDGHARWSALAVGSGRRDLDRDRRGRSGV
jgi:diketogulonate reductase-like aldo/keto reductase